MKIKNSIIFGLVFLFFSIFIFWCLISVLIDQKDPIPFLDFLQNKEVDLSLFFLSCGSISSIIMFYFFNKENIFEKTTVKIVTAASIFLFLIAIL